MQDWRYAGRICNIDVKNVPAGLIDNMCELEERIQSLNLGKPFWYMNRTVKAALRKAHYMISCTWNAPANAFTAPEEFFEGKGIDAVLLPIHKAFQFIGMKPMQTFMANDVVKNPTYEADFKRFVELVRKNFSAL